MHLLAFVLLLWPQQQSSITQLKLDTPSCAPFAEHTCAKPQHESFPETTKFPAYPESQWPRISNAHIVITESQRNAYESNKWIQPCPEYSADVDQTCYLPDAYNVGGPRDVPEDGRRLVQYTLPFDDSANIFNLITSGNFIASSSLSFIDQEHILTMSQPEILVSEQNSDDSNYYRLIYTVSLKNNWHCSSTANDFRNPDTFALICTKK